MKKKTHVKDKILIRDYTDKDFISIKILLQRAWMFYPEIDRRHIYRKKIKHENGSIIIAESDGKVIGMVMFILDPWLSFGYHLVVDERHRKQGIGEKLIREAAKRIKARGGKKIVIFVDQKNQTALSLYSRMKFTNLGAFFCLTKSV